MDALILAGGIPRSEDSLYPLTQGKPKALLEINGRFLIDCVSQALQNAPSIQDILIVGLTEDTLSDLPQNVYTLPDQGGLVQNGIAGLLWLKKHRGRADHIAIASVDIPCPTSEIVEDVLHQCQPLDYKLYYYFVTRTVMEQQFPNSHRTFVKLNNVEVAGADFMIAHTDFAESNEALYVAITNGRKHAWKLARIIGLRFLLKFLFRQLSLDEIEQTASHILQMPIKVMLSPHAEIGMDIDKPKHYAMIQTYDQSI